MSENCKLDSSQSVAGQEEAWPECHGKRGDDDLQGDERNLGASYTRAKKHV